MDPLQENCFNAGAPVAATTSTVPPPPAAPRKRRRQGITDDADVEVITLSAEEICAKTLFHCQWCYKGFNREQNLMLHLRVHNIPQVLSKRPVQNITDEKRKVYLCPEASCAYHDRRNALGDLSSLRKHFKRKHAEKTMNCNKCSKKYAIEADLRAHVKICGTKEYKCVCGSLFSRRDSYMTHKILCDSLQTQPLSSLGSQIPTTQTNVEGSFVPTISHDSISDPNKQPAFNSNTTARGYSFPNLSSSNESVHWNMTKTANNSSTQGSEPSDNSFDIDELYDRLFGASSVPTTTMPQEAPQQGPSLVNSGSSASFLGNLENSTAAGSIPSNFDTNAFNVFPDLSSTASGNSYFPVSQSLSGTYENPDHLQNHWNDISGNVSNLQGEAMQRDPLEFANSQMGDYSTSTVNENTLSTLEDVVAQTGGSSGFGVQQINQQEQFAGQSVGGDANFPMLQNDFQILEKWLGLN